MENKACIIGELCAWEFKAGFELDWGFGIRLPMNVSLDSTDPVNEGDTFVPTSMSHGVDWSATDFTAAGIAPEDGNEYLMSFTFFLGVHLYILEIPVINIGPDVDIQESSSFATPFGPGSVFNLPTIDLPIYTLGISDAYIEFGAGITPQAGSDEFRANWMASSDLSGSGALTWTDPAVAENLSSVFAIDGPAVGALQIKDTKYVFNQFLIVMGIYFDIDIFGLFDERYDIPLATFDLSNLIPDVAVPIHPGANPTTLNSSLTVNNVAPTAVINLAAADLINGIDTFFADMGQSVLFQGSSYDPGRDDLMVEWDFGDGIPTPDKATPHPLMAPTGPNNVTETQSQTWNGACLYQLTLRSTDSDGDFTEDTAAVVVRPGGPSRARLAGYWQHQFKGNGHVDYSEDDLGCLLEIVGFMSTVFDEARDASTPAMAYDVMHLKGNGGSEVEKLDRELLMTWMNFAIGAFDVDTMVDTDWDMMPDTTFEAALALAEAVRLDGMSTAMQLQMQRQIVHYVCTQNTQSTTSVLTSSGRDVLSTP